METGDTNVAIIVADGHEDLEFWYPYLRLQEADGVAAHVVTQEDRAYKSKHGYPVEPDHTLDEVDAGDYDAVVLPGGRSSPDALRTDERVQTFIRSIYDRGDLVAAICHAPWIPISAGIVDGHTMTCYPTIQDDLTNAGADYVDEEVVVSDNVITSRDPGDLPAFLTAIIDHLPAR